MSSDLVQLADAIVESLNGATFSPTFTAVRKVVPLLDLSKIGDGLLVQVIPRSAEFEGGSRSAVYSDLAIDIGVQKRISTQTTAEADELLALVQAIGERLHLVNFHDIGSPGNVACWRTMSNDPILASDHLTKFGVFTSVLTLTYRATRRK